ncbi:MAG: formylmethanofuran dehydrogenase subunit [Gemmatimonadetes bacterium]|nr:formylmethanofuran dehydrogenase subunit [Gemmatimonadota bacterium]
MPASPVIPEAVSNVACPFCGLVCDDLEVSTAAGRVTVQANGCALALAAFERGNSDGGTGPRIDGVPASLADAAATAARLLLGSRLPVIGGLATDVEGARAAGRLADRLGGVLDHMNSATFLRNTMVLQDSGWIATTLSEVRNRADLLIVAGGDVVSRFPRFFERCIANGDTLFGEGRTCDVIFLGPGVPAGSTIPGIVPTVIPCDVTQLAAAFGLLRALLAGRPVQAESAAGMPLATWRSLVERMKVARYGVMAWAAGDFPFPHAELTVQSLCELVKELNLEGRFSGLPLGGSDGDITADAVHLWQTGFGSRTSFGQGIPENDAYHHSTARLLARGEADVLVWISSLNEARTPPPTSIPTIVLGCTGMAFEREPAVFIPVGTPGLDHAGHLFRTDRVVALPLQQLRPSTLPSVADVLAAIHAALEES